jgi:hypothetical protein
MTSAERSIIIDELACKEVGRGREQHTWRGLKKWRRRNVYCTLEL